MASFFVKYLHDLDVFEDQKLQYLFGHNEKRSKDEILPSNKNEIVSVSSRFNPRSVKIAQNEALLWGTSQKSAIEYGNILHKILSEVLYEDDVNFAVTKALETGLINIDQKGVVQKTIADIINHDDLRIYYSRENTIYNEQTIIQHEGKTVKPDRIVITSTNEVFLLEYKTGIHSEKHKLQLENYQNVLEKMNFKVVARTLIYIGEKIEVVQF
jgi:hypothetical protein